MIIDLFLITVVICFIIDVSGIVSSIKRAYLRRVFKMRNPDISNLVWKPFDCSLCLTFWFGLIYLIATSHLNLLGVALVSFFSMVSSNISGFLFLVKDILSAIENWLEKLINK